MNQLTLYALNLRLWLEAIHPMAPWLALSLGAWATVYLWRKLLPGLWLKLETLDKPLSVAIGALPSIIMTTAVGALTAGSDPWIVVGASLMGVAAPLFHHLLKALPIPYRGEPTSKAVPPSRTMLLLVLMCTSGCTVPLERARTAGIESRQAGASPLQSADIYCRKLDNARTTWGAVAKGSGALAGAGGITAIPIDSREAQIGLAASSAVAAGVAIVAVYVAEQKGAAWARDCSGDR